jgi:hypothetical protein
MGRRRSLGLKMARVAGRSSGGGVGRGKGGGAFGGVVLVLAILFASCGTLVKACECSSDGPYTAANVQGTVTQLRDEAVVERVPEPITTPRPPAAEPPREPPPPKATAKKHRSSTHAKPRPDPPPKPKRVAEPAPRECCKYCSKGIPCGETCISASKTCHRGPGCAC